MRFFILCLVCQLVNAAEVRIVNLTGTNVVIAESSASTSLRVPPGELALNLEPGTWVITDGGIETLSASDYTEVWRFTKSSAGNSIVCERALEPPLFDTAMSGFISGLQVFGFGWMVSALVTGLGVANGVRVRAWSSDV